jgi:hypothetical protein
MATVAASFEVPSVSIGRVLQRAADTVRHNPALSVALAFFFGAVPMTAFTFLLSKVERSALVLTVADYALPGTIALTFIQLFIGAVVGVLVQGAMVTVVLTQDQGQRARAGDALAQVLRSLVSLLGLGLLTGIAVDVGMTLLVVPAVILYTLWCVASSAVVAEGEGLFMALDRSQKLTQGARWKVFAVLLLLEAVNVALGMLFLASRLFAFSLQEGSAGYLAMIGVVQLMSCLMWATVQASLYVELVRWKEGASPENLAEVFA